MYGTHVTYFINMRVPNVPFLYIQITLRLQKQTMQVSMICITCVVLKSFRCPCMYAVRLYGVHSNNILILCTVFGVCCSHTGAVTPGKVLRCTCNYFIYTRTLCTVIIQCNNCVFKVSYYMFSCGRYPIGYNVGSVPGVTLLIF